MWLERPFSPLEISQRYSRQAVLAYSLKKLLLHPNLHKGQACARHCKLYESEVMNAVPRECSTLLLYNCQLLILGRPLYFLELQTEENLKDTGAFSGF